MKKFIVIHFVLALLLFSQGCASQKELSVHVPVFDYKYDTITKVYYSDFTKASTGGIDVLTDSETNFVAYNYCGDNTIKIIDHSTDSTIIINQYNENCKEINTRIVDNDIYVVTADNKVLLYCDKEANSELFIDLMQIDKFKQSGLTVERHKRGGDQHVNISKDHIYFRVNQNYDDNLGHFSNLDSGYPAFAKLNIISKDIRFYGATPYFSEYSEYGFISHYYDLYVGDSIITSTSINGEIEIISTLSGETSKKELKSKFDATPIQKIIYPTNKADVNNVKTKHYLTSPNYEPLFYNPFTKYYYRIFHPALDELNEQGLLNTESDKKCVLMILNQEMELIDEVLLPINRMQILKLYPTKSGVKISLPELVNVTPEKVTFKFLTVNHFNK